MSIWKTQFAIVYMIGDLVFCDVKYKVDTVYSSVMLISHTTEIMNSGTQLAMGYTRSNCGTSLLLVKVMMAFCVFTPTCPSRL